MEKKHGPSSWMSLWGTTKRNTEKQQKTGKKAMKCTKYHHQSHEMMKGAKICPKRKQENHHQGKNPRK